MNHAAEPTVPLAIHFLSEARQQLAASAGTIDHCLAQLDDSHIWYRPRPEMNSIGNLVLHLTGNIRQRVVSQIGDEPFERNRFAEFTERGPIPRDELSRKFHDVVERADAVLAGVPADRLHEHCRYEVTAGPIDGTIQALILRTVTHLAGHAQEIVFLTRLQLGEQYTFKAPAGVPPTMRSGAGRS